MPKVEDFPRCPYCNESYYTTYSTWCTALGWRKIYKDGEMISKDPNTYTTECKCMSCKKYFNIVRNDMKKQYETVETEQPEEDEQ